MLHPNRIFRGKNALKLSGYVGLIFLIIELSFLPYFFGAMEKRTGATIHDIILQNLPAYNVSIPIFILIWGMAALMLIRAYKTPRIIPVYVWAYFIICLTRMLTIYFVPLEPPAGIIPLQDPLTGIFYGEHTIVKDLFYSGHTATLSLIFLCLQKRWEKAIALLALLTLVVLLLVQHVHFTIDIIAAPFFVYFAYWVSKRFNNFTPTVKDLTGTK